MRARGFFGGASDTHFSLPLCNFSQSATEPSATEGFSLLFFVFFPSLLSLELRPQPSTQPGPRPSPPLRSSTSVAGPCGLAAATQPGPHVSPPTQLPTPESKPSGAEVRRRHTLERVTARGEGNTWPGANLLCTLSLSLALARSLSYSVNHSVTTLRALPPTLLTCSSLSVSPARIFTLVFSFSFPTRVTRPTVSSATSSNVWQTVFCRARFRRVSGT